MAQIEPVEFLWINGEIKLGVNLRVYSTYFGSDRVKSEITDIDDNLLFSTIIYAITYEDVAQQLGLTLIKEINMAQLPKEKAKELVDKFYPRATSFSSDRKNQNENAKECAIKAVDEVISNIEPSVSMDIISARITYWNQVKNEINNL